jgi:hypothetical protein
VVNHPVGDVDHPPLIFRNAVFRWLVVLNLKGKKQTLTLEENIVKRRYDYSGVGTHRPGCRNPCRNTRVPEMVTRDDSLSLCVGEPWTYVQA